MGSFLRALLQTPILRPILRPLLRLVLCRMVLPRFTVFLQKVIRLQEIDPELEKDLEQWFRGSLLLLAATANMEQALYGWLPFDLEGDQAWLGIGFRLLLAVGVIEAMPDQELFAVIHPGPPKLSFNRGVFREIWEKKRAILKGLLCQHLNRSSPVFAIMAAIFPDDPEKSVQIKVGWICYGMAITQYLIIGLVTSRDKALDVLGQFDRQVAIRRRELIDEFELGDKASPGADPSASETSPEVAKPADEASNSSSSGEIVAKSRDARYLSE